MKTRLELHVCSLLVNSQKAMHPAGWNITFINLCCGVQVELFDSHFAQAYTT